MNVLSDSSGGGGTNYEFSLHSTMKQDSKDAPDLYPDPDSVHVPPLVEKHGLASSSAEADGSVLTLGSQRVTNTVSPIPTSFDATHAEEGDKPVSRPTPPLVNLDKIISPTSLPLNTFTSVSSPGAEPIGRDSDCVAEDEDSVEDKLQLLPLQKNKGQRRPGVILLGRGNSFSLGRSEVIFLHNTKRYRHKGKESQQHDKRVVANGRLDCSTLARHSTGEPTGVLSTTGADFSCNADPPAASGAGSSDTEPGRPSPPPLSNQGNVQSGGISLTNHTSRPIVFTSGRSTDPSNEYSAGVGHTSTTSDNLTIFEKGSDKNSTDDELATLWARAERVMAGKQRAVLDVLAQFGVGDGRKEATGEEEEEEEEEEGVWQVVESKAYAIDR